MTTEQVREYLQIRIEEEKWTQRDLAEKSGLRQGGISMFLNGKRGMTLHTLERIAQAFHLEPWQILKEAANIRAFDQV
jgi:transcriptional regulator with XRE-family HTH domain